MPTTSYFRINHPGGPKKAAYVFFDDRDEPDTREAHAHADQFARAVGGFVSVFRPTLNAGPWDEVQVIGHRKRSLLESILDTPALGEQTREEVRIELAALDEAFAARRGEFPLDSRAVS